MWWFIAELGIALLAGILIFPIIAVLRYGGNLWRILFGGPYKTAITLARGGITRMTLSRDDYHILRVGAGPLRNYLATADRCIDIVSISLNVTQAENSLISLFEEKIRSNPGYSVRVTLLDPRCAVIPNLAKSLDIEPNDLNVEIEDTIKQLNDCRLRLGPIAGERLQVFVHDTLPIGSAILLDATPDSGRIQIETKLYRAPRIESFGFEVSGPSEFYRRNFAAWQKVFTDSRPAMIRLNQGPSLLDMLNQTEIVASHSAAQLTQAPKL